MTAAALTSKKVVLELGGKSPTVILPGADLDRAVAPSILRFCRNAGQGCGATTRILVHRDDYPAFLDRARRVLDALPVGDPFDERTEVGPLISAEHRDRVRGYLDRALNKGATVLAGGEIPEQEGFLLGPVLLGDVHPDDEIAQDELFAPVAVVFVYDTVDEAVAVANNSRYGLNALVWGDPEQAGEVARRLRTGTVAINGGGGSRPDVPWVGARQSGVGMDMGEDGFGEFFTIKHLQWPV
jgi:aldehyde dehydrogenase (NAD+)/betaine-aldehyde dehydrogenase